MSWRVIGRTDEGGVRKQYTVIGGLTKREAESWRKTEDPRSQVSVGVEEERPDLPPSRVIGPTPSEAGLELQRRRIIREKKAAAPPVVRSKKPTITYGGLRTDATAAQVAKAQREGASYYVGGKKISTTREIGFTPTGGIYNIPSGAIYTPGYSKLLSKPTGKETAADIIMKYRGQKIDISKLPPGSLIEGRPIKDYADLLLSPGSAALGAAAARVAHQKELARIPTTKQAIAESLLSRQEREFDVSKGIISVKPQKDFGEKFTHAFITDRTGFESQLGTGFPKWYATTPVVSSAYLFGKDIKTKVKGYEGIERLSPTEYAKFLEKEGKIEFYPKAKRPFGDSPGFHIFQPISKKRIIGISPELDKTYPGTRPYVTAHELIHARTPKILFDIEKLLKIPYRYQLTEYIARRGMKEKGKEGFRTTPIPTIILGEIYTRRKEIISGAKFGAYPLTAPFEFSSKVFTKYISPTLTKAETGLGKTAEELYFKSPLTRRFAIDAPGFEKPEKISQPTKEQYSPDSLQQISQYLGFHDLGEKPKKIIKVSKDIGYAGAGLGVGIASKVIGFAKFSGEHPLATTAMVATGGWATKYIGKFGVPSLFIGSSALTAPSGQKLRTGLEVAGTFGLIPLLAKPVRAAKATPGRIIGVLERRRATERVITEAEGIPYKARPGMESLTRIVPATIRKTPAVEFLKRERQLPSVASQRAKAKGLETAAEKQIQRLEREGTGDIIGTVPKGLLAVRPTTGADFRGISRVPPKEPITITKKGNILFKELGIEEAGILKPDRIPKKIRFSMGSYILGTQTVDLGVSFKQPKIIKYEKISPTRKVGTIETIDFSRPIPVSRIKGRATPEQYALFLEGRGEIKYDPFVSSKLLGKDIGGIYLKKGEVYTDKPAIAISTNFAKYVGGTKLREKAITHELIHYKTPKSILEFGESGKRFELPYRLQPAEIVSYSLQGYFGKRGFKVPIGTQLPTRLQIGEGTIRKEGPLRFEYPRERLTEKVIQAEAPRVGISPTRLQTGLQTYAGKTVSIGRYFSGFLEKKGIFDPLFSFRKSLFYRKLPSGKIEVKELSRAGDIIRKYQTEYSPEIIKIDPQKYIQTKRFRKEGFDVGKKTEEMSYFDLRKIIKGAEFKIAAKSKEFTMGRDIQKSIMGKAKQTVSQIDKAGYQREYTRVGDIATLEIKPSDIKYAIQPTYKPSIRELSTEKVMGELVTAEKSIKRPPLYTQRADVGEMDIMLAYKKSRYKPIKKISKGVSERFNKAMFSSFAKSKAGAVSLVNIQREIGKPIEIYAQEPILKQQAGTQIRLPISRESILGIPRGRQAPKVFPFAKQKRKEITKPKYEIISKVKQPVLSIQKDIPTLRKNIISKSMIESMTKTPAKSLSRGKSLSKTAQKTIQKTLQKQKVAQRLSRRPSRRAKTKKIISPPEIPTKLIPPIMFFPKKPKLKKKKKKQAFGYFYRGYKILGF